MKSYPSHNSVTLLEDLMVNNNPDNIVVKGSYSESDTNTNWKDYAFMAKRVVITKEPAYENQILSDGKEHELIPAVEGSLGTPMYSLTKDGTYTESIPKASAVGAYTVWYYVKADTAGGVKYDSELHSAKASIVANAFSQAGTEQDPYLISSKLQWDFFVSLLAGNDSQIIGQYAGKYYKLTNDLAVGTPLGTETIAGQYQPEHYVLKGYGREYSKEGEHTPAYAGENLNVGNGVNVLYLYYALEDNPLTFYSDTEGAKVLKTASVRYGTAPAAYEDAEPEDRENYTFAGWATEPGIVVDSYLKKDEVKLNDALQGKLVNWTAQMKEAKSVYPIWIRDRLAVVLKEDVGDTSESNLYLDAKQSKSFTVNLNEKLGMRYLKSAGRDGYKLDGWYTQGGVLWNGAGWETLEYAEDPTKETEGWGVTPEYCDKLENGLDYIQTNEKRKFNYYTVTLTAHWSPVPVGLQYDLNGGTGPIADSGSYKLGDTVTVADAVPTSPSGQTFIGWKLGNGTTLYNSGGQFVFDNWSVVANGTIKLTAQYMDTPTTAVYFNSSGGTALAPVVQEVGSRIETEPAVTKPGYTFDGWYIGESKVDFPYTVPGTNVTMRAKWTVQQFTITFDTGDGTGIDAITMDYGEVVTAPADPEKRYYTFADWYPALPSVMPAENLTVTAIWTPVQYKVRYRTDADSISEDSYIFGAEIKAPADPAKQGYTFSGWMNESGEIGRIPAYMPVRNLEFTAKWKESHAAPSAPEVSAAGQTVTVVQPEAGTE